MNYVQISRDTFFTYIDVHAWSDHQVIQRVVGMKWNPY